MTELVALNVRLSAGLIDQRVFSVLVTAALVIAALVTATTVPLLPLSLGT